MSQTLLPPPIGALPRLAGTWRFGGKDYRRLAEIGVIEWEEALE